VDDTTPKFLYHPALTANLKRGKPNRSQLPSHTRALCGASAPVCCMRGAFSS